MYREEIDNYIAQLDKSGNTCESYRRDLIQMEDFLCAHEGARAEDYARAIAEEKTASTVARIYSAMNGFFRYLIAKEVLKSNPIDGFTAPKIVKNPRPVLNEEKKSQIVAMPKGYGNKAVRDRAMLSVMFDTGYKVTRLIGIKTSEVESLKLSKETKAILEDYIYGTRDLMLAGAESDLLFTNCSGKPMSRQGFWKILKAYTKEGADGRV